MVSTTEYDTVHVGIAPWRHLRRSACIKDHRAQYLTRKSAAANKSSGMKGSPVELRQRCIRFNHRHHVGRWVTPAHWSTIFGRQIYTSLARHIGTLRQSRQCAQMRDRADSRRLSSRSISALSVVAYGLSGSRSQRMRDRHCVAVCFIFCKYMTYRLYSLCIAL